MEVAMAYRRRGKKDALAGEDIDVDGFEKTYHDKSKESMQIICQALAQHFIFSSLAEEDRVDFAKQMKCFEVQPGQDIIEQGAEGDYVYVLESGAFDFIMDGKTIGETSRKGTIFGEFALMYGAPRAATVRGTEPSIIWGLDRTAFRCTLASTRKSQRSTMLELLRSVPLLDPLEDGQLNTIADTMEVMNFQAGERIIRKGDKGRVFYIIQHGQVKCTEIGEATNRQADVTLSAGEYFGERALLTGDTRAANVFALSDCTLVALAREDFDLVLGPLREVLDENLQRRVLSGVSVLSELTQRQKDELIDRFQTRKFQDGELIVRQGDAGDEFFIVKSGSVKVLYKDETGTESQINKMTIGDYFGEMALLEDEPRQATVAATGGETEVFVLAKADFDTVRAAVAHTVERDMKNRETGMRKADRAAFGRTLKLDDLHEISVLGTGSFGRVTLVRYKEGHVFALKALAKAEIQQKRQQENIIMEKNILTKCDHPFILSCIRTFVDSRRVYFLLEFVQGGELFSILHTDARDGVPEDQARFYSAGVTLALAHLHHLGIAYRDLKPENIMVDRFGYPKLIDMGFAKEIKDVSFTLCGTPEYIAPEIVLGRGHNKAVDWWSLGILTYEMIVGFSPFVDEDQMSIMRSIVRNDPIFPGFKTSNAGKDFIKNLLDRDPTRRLGARRRRERDVMAHRFFDPLNFDDYVAKRIQAPWEPNVASDTDVHNFDPYDDEPNDVPELHTSWESHC